MSQSNYSQFSCPEYTDRIKQEFDFLSSQFSIVKIENEKLRSEKKELELTIKKYYESAYFLNIQLHKQALINERLTALNKQILNQIPNDEEKVTVLDIENRIMNQKPAYVPFNTEIFFVEGTKRKLSDDSKLESITKKSKTEMTKPSEIHHIVEIDPDTKHESGDEDEINMKEKEDNDRKDEDQAETEEEIEEEEEVVIEEEIEEIDESQFIITHEHELEPLTEVKKGMIEKLFTNNSKVPTGATFHLDIPHEQSVSCVAFNGDESKFFTATKGVINVWKMENPSSVPLLKLKSLDDGYIRSFTLSNDEKTLLTCGESKIITLWDIASQSPKILKSMQSESAYHYSAAFHPDSSHCFTSLERGEVALWDLRTGKIEYQLEGHSQTCSSVKFFGDNNLISASLDKTVRLWDCRMRKSTDIYNFESQIFSFDFYPEKSLGAVGMENSKISVFSIQNNLHGIHNIEQHKKAVLSLSFSKDGNFLCSGGKDKHLYGNLTPFGKNFLKEEEDNSILSVRVSPSGKFIATASWAKVATIYKVDYENKNLEK